MKIVKYLTVIELLLRSYYYPAVLSARSGHYDYDVGYLYKKTARSDIMWHLGRKK